MANKIAALPMLREDPNTSIVRLDKCQARISRSADLRSFYARKSNLMEILEHISEIIERSSIKVISFDVFDTVLLREMKSESRRFWESSEFFLQYASQNSKGKGKKNDALSKIRVQDVFLARILAAKAAYAISPVKNGNREGTFSNIARATCEILGIPELHNQYISSEISYECKSLVLNDFFSTVKSEHPEIKFVFISDMYLQSHHISEILQKKIDSSPKPLVYSSADGLGSKREGQLYANVARELGVAPEEMLHIGDNLNSDYRQAKRLGLEAVYLPIPSAEKLNRVDCYNSLASELAHFDIDLKTIMNFNY